jgi:hypothetical protein
MKKILYTVLFLCTISSYAQFGARLGVNLAKVNVQVSDSFTSISNSESYTGYYFGIFNKLYISENFALRPELNYHYFPKENESNLVNQIELPVLFDITFANVIDLIIGPSASYLFNVQGDAKSFNYSGNLGLAINLGNIQIEGRYVKGFRNVAGTDPSFDVTTNLDSIHIGLCYSLD